MKTTTFKCNPLQPRAILALQSHIDANPNGAPLHNGRSARKLYYASIVIYETKTSIVVDTLHH